MVGISTLRREGIKIRSVGISGVLSLSLCVRDKGDGPAVGSEVWELVAQGAMFIRISA